MSTNDKPVTIKSIAAALGISFSTVSKALNDDPAISNATKELVQKKAQEMHYTRNYFASTLRQKGSRSIAVIVNDIDIPAYGEMIANISSRLAAYGYTTTISDSRYSEAYERNSIQNALSRMPEAVIIAPADPCGENLKLLSPVFDTTLVMGDIGSLPSNSLYVDHYHAGYISAMHMLENQVTNNLIFGGPAGYQSSEHFMQGITDAYQEKGLRIDPDKVYRFNPVQQLGYHKFMEIWQNNPRCCEGVICFCDSMALGIYKACRELGLSIPDDISVIGYDDGPANDFTAPPLTTIHMPKDLVAAQSAQFVINKLVNGDKQLHHYKLQPHLVDRGSVRKPK